MTANPISTDTFISDLKTIMADAGEAILEVYHADGPVDVDTKSDDSPVTKADMAAHKVIDKGLQSLAGNYPILSEEGGVPDFEDRQQWERYWLVDPLDGTKEFINKNGEFTVNIALIENGSAILGMVYVPVTQTFFYGSVGNGSWKESPETGTPEKISIKPLSTDNILSVVGSRRHGAEALEAVLNKVGAKFKGTELVSMGSSLKICAVAEGTADWYPRLALTSEWDTAAAHAVLTHAGGTIVDENMKELRYNQKDSLLNPFFHALGDTNYDWKGEINA